MLADVPRGETPSDTSRRLAVYAAILDLFDECCLAWAADHLVAVSSCPDGARRGATAQPSWGAPQVASPEMPPSA